MRLSSIFKACLALQGVHSAQSAFQAGSPGSRRSTAGGLAFIGKADAVPARPLQSMMLSAANWGGSIQEGELCRSRLDCITCPDHQSVGGRNEPQTKIIGTLGVESYKVETLLDMICSGLDVARINCAHTTDQFIADAINNVGVAGRKAGKEIATMLDVKGPEIRTRHIKQQIASGEVIEGAPLSLVAGDWVDFVKHDETPIKEGVPTVSVNYPSITRVEVGKPVSIDGEIILSVVDVQADRLRCEVVEGGTFGAKRHVNLPGTYVDKPALTEKDRSDIRIAVANGVDFIAQSFVRSAEDVVVLRDYLKELEDEGVGEEASEVAIVAKIEDQSGINNIERILEVADGIMVARGDLGVEMDLCALPGLQKRLVDQAHFHGKPVVIATEMLESMTESSKPTRAEVSDVGRAVLTDVADCVMLSGETAKGRFPGLCVSTMRNISKNAEAEIDSIVQRVNYQPKTNKEIFVKKMVELAQELKGPSSLLVFTRDGSSAKTLSALRPIDTPVYAFTDDPKVARQLRINRGVQPFLLASDEPMGDSDAVERAIEFLLEKGFVVDQENLVLLTKSSNGTEMVDSIQHRVVSGPSQ